MNAVIGRVSLRVVITVVFAILLTVMAGVTWFLTFRNGRASVRDLAEQVGQLSMIDIRQNIQQYLSAPRLVLDMNSYGFSEGPSPRLGKDTLARRFAAELKRFDSVVSIAYANEKGEYVGMSRGIDGVPLALAIADESTGGRLVGFRSDDQAARLAPFDRSPDPFDARERPWYEAAVAADGPTWTPAYAWLTGDVGIDLVGAVRDRSGVFRGVLDASLTLSGIGRFLQSIRPTPHSESFILERSGLLVASSVVETPYGVPGRH